MNVGVVLGQLIMLFAMMLTGALCYKKNWVTDQSYKNISSVVVNVFNPLLMVSSIVGKEVPSDARQLVQNIILVAVMFITLIALSPLVVRLLRVPAPQRNMYSMMLVFSNLGFMGIPLITALYSAGAVLFVAFYVLVYNVLIYTYGVHLAGGKGGSGGGKGGWLRMINPGTVSSLLAVTLYALHVQLPGFVASFCSYMGNAAIPLSMMMIGVNLARQDLKAIFLDLRLYLFTAVKMVLIPVVMGLIILALGLQVDPTIFGVFVIMMGMPVGSIVVLLSEECGADSSVCSRGIAITTVLSLVTLPIVCMIL